MKITAEEFLKQYQKGGDHFAITKGEAISKLNEFAKIQSIEFHKFYEKTARMSFDSTWEHVDKSIEEIYEEFLKTKQ